jgi:diguanylate cyclase (GGDEF)-like protein
MRLQRPSFFARALLIAAEVLLVSALIYAAGRYLSGDLAPHLALGALYCLPLVHAARLSAVYIENASDTKAVVLIGTMVALVWSMAEAGAIWPHFPLNAFALNVLTRGVVFTVVARALLNFWRKRVLARGHVAEHRRAADALMKQEKEMSDALRMVRAGIWDYNILHDRFTFNDNFYRIYGTTAEEVGGYTMSAADYTKRFVHPDDMAVVGTAVADAIKTTDPNFGYDIEHKIIRKGGEVGFVRVRFFIEKDEAGMAVRNHGINQDITELKRNEEALLHLNHQLKVLSTSDGLLGIANRRYFDVRLDEEWKRAIREEKSLALLMIDVDNFKHYNDTYGHQAGDGCLQAVSQAAQSALKRPSDLLARYGGEELAVILPNTDLAGAVSVAQAVQRSLVERHIPHDGLPTRDLLTVSIGAAMMRPHEKTNPDMLIAAADRALYAAKETGRDRVVAE